MMVGMKFDYGNPIEQAAIWEMRRSRVRSELLDLAIMPIFWGWPKITRLGFLRQSVCYRALTLRQRP